MFKYTAIVRGKSGFIGRLESYCALDLSEAVEECVRSMAEGCCTLEWAQEECAGVVFDPLGKALRICRVESLDFDGASIGWHWCDCLAEEE